MRDPLTVDAGFTLVEMLSVLAIIVLLVGIGVPAGMAMTRRAKVRATQAVVESLALACLDQTRRTLTRADGGLCRAYDVDGDGWMDADPTRLDAGDPRLGVYPATYRGALLHAGVSLPAWAVGGDGAPVDRWGRTLRIAFATAAYDGKDLGIWSLGPDGIDGNTDDIRSWSTGP